jgi:hypothetical protein
MQWSFAVLQRQLSLGIAPSAGTILSKLLLLLLLLLLLPLPPTRETLLTIELAKKGNDQHVDDLDRRWQLEVPFLIRSVSSLCMGQLVTHPRV